MRFWIVEKGNVIFVSPIMEETKNIKEVVAEAIIEALKDKERLVGGD